MKNFLYSPVELFPSLQSLSLGNPTTHTSDFEIGADFLLEYSRRLIYPWRSTDSCAIKIRLLTLGPTTSTQTVNKTLQMFHTVVQQIEESDSNKFWDVESTGTLSNTELSSNSQFLTSYLKFSVECQ